MKQTLYGMLSLLLLPSAAWAQGLGEGSLDAASGRGSNADVGGLRFRIESPLNNIGSVEQFITAILNILLIIAVPVIVFFIIFAGFNYVTAQGNPEKIKTATRSLTYAIIGAVLILGGVALSEIITGVVNSFKA